MTERLSHYAIGEVIGQGGMGTVYRARDTELDRTVAVKVLSGAGGDARQQLLREARAACALTHPAIVTIHSVEHQDSADFIVMEYVDGRPLSELIPPGGLPIATAIEYAAQIAGALAAAHKAGVVHRDIKPANVMITADARVKVLDFGIARRSALDAEAMTRVATIAGNVAAEGSLVGTAGYLAPEVIGGAPAAPASDVFAFGVLLHEMVTGDRPFKGPTLWAVLDATVHATPPSLSATRRDVPEPLALIVDRCLQKKPEQRYASGAELADALAALRTPTVAPSRRRAVTAIAVVSVIAVVAVAALARVYFRERRLQAARTIAAEATRRYDSGDPVGAYRLLRDAAARTPDEPHVRDAWRTIATTLNVTSDPAGADLAIRSYSNDDDGWLPVGRTPLPEGTRLPFGQMRWRVTKDGFDPIEVSPETPRFRFVLAKAGTTPPGMAHVPAGVLEIERSGTEVSMPEFFIDTFEVTNRQFKEFVDRGGYRDRKYWTQPIVKDGRTLSFDESMALFRDATGRPGPSTWELGTYPDGQDDYPVNGVSWFEAAAYATYAGKVLPTAYHWYRASGAFGVFSEIVRVSNFNGKGPARVGSYQGLGPFGTYDMAGNVKEWCWNEDGGGRRFVLGGAFNDAVYQFRDQDARAPLERSAGFGFRCVKSIGSVDPKLQAAIQSFRRDTAELKPVDDALFEAYRRLYDYDRPKSDDVRLEWEDASPANWTRQRVSFAAAYGQQRVPADVYVPKNGHPPYQAVVYFPGSDAVNMPSSRTPWIHWIEFIIRSGRIVVYPIYQQTFERRRPGPFGPNAMREICIQRGIDYRRAVDYLESRGDVDRTRIAGYGLSLGAQLMPVFLAIEPRLRTGVLLAGGFETWDIPPEADPVNFAPRVKQPVLMVNGREDFDLPYTTAQIPLFNALGTAPADKKHVVFEGGHIPPKPQPVFKEILDWLDKYLGPVGG